MGTTAADNIIPGWQRVSWQDTEAQHDRYENAHGTIWPLTLKLTMDN